MKKILFAIVFLIGAVAVNAQSTSPRFGTAKNQDNTGRVLTYNYATVTDAAGADSVTITPNAWQTIYRIALTDSVTFKNPVVSRSFAGDNILIIASGASGTKVKFTGSNWVGTSAATLSSGGRSVIRYVFDGARWVLSGVNTQ